jgi:hypothetical protein
MGMGESTTSIFFSFFEFSIATLLAFWPFCHFTMWGFENLKIYVVDHPIHSQLFLVEFFCTFTKLEKGMECIRLTCSAFVLDRL